MHIFGIFGYKKQYLSSVIFIFKNVQVCVCMWVCACEWRPEVLDPWELESQVAVSRLAQALVAELESSEKAGALNC